MIQSALRYITLVLVLFFPLLSSANTSELNWIGHYKGEGMREDLVLEIKKEFEFLHPEVKVNLVFNTDLQSAGTYFKDRVAFAILEMILSGNIIWDVVHLDHAIYNMVAEMLNDPDWGRKHLVDFTTIPGFLSTMKSELLNEPFFRNQAGGIITGPFIEGYILNLWFNTEIGTRVGITVKERGLNIDEFLAYAEKLARYNAENNTSITFFNLATWNRLDGIFECLYRSQLNSPAYSIGEYFQPDRGRIFLETLRIFEKLSAYQPMLPEDWRNTNWEQFIGNILAGKGLFTSAGTYLYGHLIPRENSESILPVESPYVKQHNGLIGSYDTVFAVMKNSKNRQNGIDLVMLWSRPEVAEKWVDYTKNPTGIRGDISDRLLATLDSQDNVYDRFVTDMQTEYGAMPMLNFRHPLHVFGKDCPTTIGEFRESLALILEGKLKADDYYQTLIGRLADKHE